MIHVVSLASGLVSLWRPDDKHCQSLLRKGGRSWLTLLISLRLPLKYSQWNGGGNSLFCSNFSGHLICILMCSFIHSFMLLCFHFMFCKKLSCLALFIWSVFIHSFIFSERNCPVVCSWSIFIHSCTHSLIHSFTDCYYQYFVGSSCYFPLIILYIYICYVLIKEK